MVPAAPTATTGKGLAPRPIFDLSPRELENVLIERPLWAEARWRRAPTSAKKLRVPVNLVRRMHVTDSLLQLQVVRKKSARMLARVREIEENGLGENGYSFLRALSITLPLEIVHLIA